MAVRSIVTAFALLLVGSGCGDDSVADVVADTGSTATTAVAASPSIPPLRQVCGDASTASDAAVVELADRLIIAPIHATLDRVTFGPQTIDAFGIDLDLVEIRSVEIVDSEPWRMLPGVEEGDPPTNSFAGNSVFTSGAVLEVDDGSETSTVTLTLAAGGADVLAAMGPLLEETDDDLLVGLCAVVATYPDDEAGIFNGDVELVAIGVSEGGPAHAVTPAFADLVAASNTMAKLASAG